MCNQFVSAIRNRSAMLVCALALAGCNGNGGSPAAVTPPVIGTDGGTVTEASGASVIVPAGALTTTTTIRIARDSTGAPPLPADLTGAGSTYVITPHGGEFAEGAEVRIPAPNVTLQPNQEFKLAKAQPGEAWVVLEDTELDAGMLSVRVGSFSFFRPVIVTYLLPIAQAEPLRVDATLACAGAPCLRSMGTVSATYTVTTNNGQSPANCLNPTLAIFTGNLDYSSGGGPAAIPIAGGSLAQAIVQSIRVSYSFGVGRRCSGYWSSFGTSHEKRINWLRPPEYPHLAIMRAPATLDIVEGMLANLDVVMGGGASRNPDPYNRVTADHRTLVDWQRSDDNGASWRVIARSYENEANPLPFGPDTTPGLYWSVRHGFVGAATDQGSLIRVYACFTPRDAAAPPCVTGIATRLNVLQQSAAPEIVAAPRSMLVRTGQTANLSVTASGLPAPTLQWQTRTANSSGAWSDVTTGTGATTANYITAPMALADNGVQFRAVATNSMGSAESSAVAVSVSDLDVAPTITTQPGSLSVASGSDAVFAVVARGTEALSYQWYRNGAAIAGANSPVLRLTAVTNANTGSYTVTVGNDAGDADSNAAVLTVTAGFPAAVAPTIVTQPAAITVNTGNTATFAVGVDGSGPFTFQWRKDGVNIPGSTSAVLTLNSVTNASAGSYSIVISNSVSPGGVASAAAVLTVLASGEAVVPTVVTQPATVVVAPGGSAVLAVAATGSGPLNYQWLFNGSPISGELDAVLILPVVTGLDAGDYSVTVSNNLGSVVSELAGVILLGAPLITQQPAAATALENETATFSVVASGSNLHYQWLLNGSTIASDDEATYTTPALTTANSGAVYSVIVYNGAGIVLSQSVVLTVTTPTAIAATTLVSVAPDGNAANNVSGEPSLSADGRLVAFTSVGTDLVPGFTNAPTESGHAYVRDLVTGVTTLINQTPGGGQSNRGVINLQLAAGGRFAVFTSLAGDLVADDTNGSMDVFRRDLQTGVTERLNVLPGGSQITNAGSSSGDLQLDISADGRWIIFLSAYDLLVNGDPLPMYSLYLRDAESDQTRLVASSPTYGVALSAISNDGTQIVFAYGIPSPAPHVLNSYDVVTLVTDTLFTLETTSFPDGIGQGLGMSDDGRYVAFAMRAAAFLGSTSTQVVVLDRSTAPATLTIASTGVNGIGNGTSRYPELSGDGRYVLFNTIAPNLTGGQATSSRPFLMVRDLVTQTTSIASRRPNGTDVWILAVDGHHAISQDGAVLGLIASQFDMTGGAGEYQVYAAPHP